MEVLSKKEVPSGSWRSAEIMSGSGHYYTVRYDKFEGGSNQTVVERVSRKAIRPCPPSLEVLENWIPGDVVEVFNDRSWKMATVSEVLGKNNYLVRLLGSSSEFKVCKFDIRARRSWQDDKWVLMHKVGSILLITFQLKLFLLLNCQMFLKKFKIPDVLEVIVYCLGFTSQFVFV